MNTTRISKFNVFGILAIAAAAVSCAFAEPEDIPLVKLGAIEKEYVVEAEASTFDIDIYTNGPYHIEYIEEADWLSLACSDAVDGKAKITATCEFNEDFKRRAGFVLCSDLDSRRDTLYIKQKALVDAAIAFANSSVIVPGAGGHEREQTCGGDAGKARW